MQWGPIIHANGVSTASGGVCANPVPSTATTSSNSETSTATTSSNSETSTATTTTTATSAPTQTKEILGTRVSGQGAVCGEGEGKAVEVNATTKQESSYCIKREATPTTTSSSSSETGTATTSSSSDPFPSLKNGDEIANTRITSPSGINQSEWEQSSLYKAFNCPAGTGKASGVDLNFTASQSDDRWFAYCVKSFQESKTSSTSTTETSTATTSTSSDTSTVTSPIRSDTSTATTSINAQDSTLCLQQLS